MTIKNHDLHVKQAAAIRVKSRRLGRVFAHLTIVFAALLIAVGAWVPNAFQPLSSAAANPCGPPVTSVIACENSKPGDAPSNWSINGSGDSSIQGFATAISVKLGDTVHFKISTTAASYHIDILRIGYYNGIGARVIAAGMHPTAVTSQPACLSDASTGLVDCGNWSESATWAVPASAVSGIYFAHLVRDDDPTRSSHIYFVVRDEQSHSDVVFQTSDATWQAYNQYGGNDFYVGGPAPQMFGNGRSYKVSYNRPLITRDCCAQDFVWYSEYPMVRFLEANGYDISYISSSDADRSASLIQQHKVWVDAGHDEYWSGAMRSNLTAARDAGVNLAFISGNNIYWKTRWEPSIDGTSTSHRTLVCYKETWANAAIDPQDPSTWTGSWRDPRFSPPADGGRPENALTGTLWTVNVGTVTAQVPYADSRVRFWRNSPVATLAPGQTASLAANTVGYEWNEDVDNGFRPPGVIDLSSTTANVPQKILDFGSTVGPGTATHSFTLYRAASGALVFSSATVQFAWGLDDNHDGLQGGTDPSMQQAMVNLLADMGVQPASLRTGLVAATKSTDTTPPASAVTSPSAGSTATVNSPVTISGTATDSGGGVVGGVEVSTDGGSTWHPAQGHESWSYTWIPTRQGSATITSRATDDSGNIETPSSSVQVNVAINCPCSLWTAQATPQTQSNSDVNGVELGVRFRSDADGYITGLRFFKGAQNTGTHVGHLWNASGALMATATFGGETTTGWQSVSFGTRVPIAANTQYVASYYAPSGGYATDLEAFATSNVDIGYLHALRDAQGAPNGVFAYGTPPKFPSQSYEAANYWVDVVFVPGTGPSVASTSPAGGATGVSTASPARAVFNEAIDPNSLTFSLADASGNAVAGSVSYNSNTFAATYQPTSALVTGTRYIATVNANDTGGNAMTVPYSWSFTTSGIRPCPCSIWSPSVSPAQPDGGDTTPVEVGTRIFTDVSGYVNGVRFYKGNGNVGSHTGHLWSASGTLLATVTFTNESASGWQEADFNQQVAISANTPYVVSYFAPVGHYSVNSAFFTVPADAPPVHGYADSPSNPDGVYLYGSSGGFPQYTYKQSNYWVDAVFTTQLDATPPSVLKETPAPGANAAAVSSLVTATFDRAIQPSSLSMTITDSGGHAAAGNVSYDGQSMTATFTPASSLAGATTFNVSVRATSASGGVMPSPATWTFSTEGANCPCTIFPAAAAPQVSDSGDTAAVELGVRFQSDISGYITAIRFYRSSANAGPHIVNLWSASGALLGSATSSSESSSGWQQVSFPGAVAIAANTTYVASYYDSAGHYSDTPQGLASAVDALPLRALSSASAGGNGVYAYGASSSFPTSTHNATDYGVDVVFSVGGTSTPPPSVIATSPAANSFGASGSSVKATFSEAISPATINFAVADATGAAVTGSVSYAQASHTATFTPSSPLGTGANYTATVSASDLSGQAMTAPATWSFVTASPSCPCTVWSASATPPVVDSGDTAPLELGVKISSDSSGYITGVRFYKATTNTGTHVGSLWTAGGSLLATGTFSNESAAGWQQLTFSTPVAITAGTTYVAGYYAPSGHYSFAGSGLSAGVNTPPLHALGNGAAGGNGVYVYGASPAFPTSSYNATNYYVDVVFTPSAPVMGDTAQAPHVSTVAAGTAVAYQTTATLSGTPGAAYIYLDAVSTATQLVIGVYSDAGGSPGTLLGLVTLTGPVSGGWNRVPISGFTVTAGTRYWIAALSPAGKGAVALRDGDGGAASVTSTSTTSSTLPGTWAGGTAGTAGLLSAYLALH